jgi:DNA-binding CsgD family transcriptional regulator
VGEELTAREQGVIGLLTTLYRKLGARDRYDAVAHGRQLGLL